MCANRAAPPANGRVPLRLTLRERRASEARPVLKAVAAITVGGGKLAQSCGALREQVEAERPGGVVAGAEPAAGEELPAREVVGQLVAQGLSEAVLALLSGAGVGGDLRGGELGAGVAQVGARLGAEPCPGCGVLGLTRGKHNLDGALGVGGAHHDPTLGEHGAHRLGAEPLSVSPHSASTSDRENARLTDLFCDNLRRYLAGDALRNVLNTTTLY